ncbi:MAG: MBOAT family O-acyltransferase [Saccharofermentanales bacterium]|jgi:alginate O-acetyltransferase complex protein AlgI
MVFSSATFVLLFLPLVYFITRALPLKAQNIVLLIASLVFYAWGEPVYVFLMLASCLVNYGLALIPKTRSKLALWMAAIYNIGMLGVFKYADFFIENINALLQTSIPLPRLALPIGISFYTFQALSYVIDVHRGKVAPTKNFLHVLLYIAFFPQLIAGPIVIYKDIAPMITDREMTWAGGAEGLARFIVGLSKKLLIANTAAVAVDRLYAQTAFGTGAAWLMAFAYMIQIYFDFSGYSDMAIGMGTMFGFRFKENFRHPYAAESIQDFWRRWHISLSNWFKEYVYIPLGGNRRGKGREILNKWIVFTLTGLWHGAAWTFLIWGWFHGTFLTLEATVLKPKRWPRWVRHVYALVVIAVGFVIFRAESIVQAGAVLKAMFVPTADTLDNSAVIRTFMSPLSIVLMAVAVAACIPRTRWSSSKKPALKYTCAAVLWVICLLNLATTSYNPFIYFRF